MFNVDERTNNISIVKGDFGIVLPIEIDVGRLLEADDNFNFNIYDEKSNTPIVEKAFANIQNNTIEFMLTKEETDKLDVGTYFYDINWFKNDIFLGNIINNNKFIVEKKAGG